MVLHNRAHLETERQTVLYRPSKQFDKQCVTMRSIAQLTAQTHSHLGIWMRNKTEWTKGRKS